MLNWVAFILLCIPNLLFSAVDDPDYYLVILVTARQLDYTDSRSLFRSMAKHPSDGSKNGDVGHAWIFLRGVIDGVPVTLEGGHSGELGVRRPKYFEGVMNYYMFGYADPTPEQMENQRFEPDPIKYLWESPKDGFFQDGCGGHVPTYAVQINLTPQQFTDITQYIDAQNYNYLDYAITRNQCSSYVTQVAKLGGLLLEDKVTMNVSASVRLFGENIRLWEDPCYSSITFSSPDVLEYSMKKAVSEGRAVDATLWYKKKYPKPFRLVLKEWNDSFIKLPERWSRALMFR